jgi:hypothetical protein
MVGLVALLVGAPVACGSLLGIDSGTLRGDASTGSFDDVVTIDPPDDASSPSDGGFVPVDAGPACTPDLNWCTTHCGTGPDNCGQPRGCSSLCPQGESCIANSCTCTPDPTWCNGRCGETTDNCGNKIDCLSCEAGVACYSNVCGCMPDAPSTTCSGKQCASALNNCNLAVNCGVQNSTECASGEYCLASDTCCTPDDTTACGGKCQVSVTDNCGLSVPCPQTCPNNGVCLKGNCCTPSGCGGSCIDNCGQKNSSCCPVTPPPDAGSPPPDAGTTPPVDSGGGCGAAGASCATGCCSQLCSSQYICVNSCDGQGTTCTTTSDCCYGLTCTTSGVVQPLLTGPIGFDSGVFKVYTCQSGVLTAQ